MLLGTSTGYQPDSPGFFFVPADSDSNTKSCCVVFAATEKTGFL